LVSGAGSRVAPGSPTYDHADSDQKIKDFNRGKEAEAKEETYLEQG